MNSWAVLLYIDLSAGHYLNLSPRPVTQYDWVILWSLAQANGPVAIVDTV